MCGEGGEYETLVLDCPLFRHARIALDAWQTVPLSPPGPGAVAILHPISFRLQRKAPPPDSRTAQPRPGHSAEALEREGAPGTGQAEPLGPAVAGAGEAHAAAEVVLMPDDWPSVLTAGGGQDAEQRRATCGLQQHTAEAAVQVSCSGVQVACMPRAASEAHSSQAGSPVEDALHAALVSISQGALAGSPLQALATCSSRLRQQVHYC